MEIGGIIPPIDYSEKESISMILCSIQNEVLRLSSASGMFLARS